MSQRMYEDRPWVKDGACYGLGEVGRIFTSGIVADVVKAKDVCRDCPVAKPCLEWAMTHDEIGIWGGTTEYERVQLHRRRLSSVR